MCHRLLLLAVFLVLKNLVLRPVARFLELIDPIFLLLANTRDSCILLFKILNLRGLLLRLIILVGTCVKHFDLVLLLLLKIDDGLLQVDILLF